MKKELDGYSMDLGKVNKEKLKSIFPECFMEDKLDIDKLLSLCGEYMPHDFEKYNFEWKGKSECLQLALKRSSGTLRPCPEESIDFNNTNNVYIQGDNLEVLRLLQTSYYRKVKMIYIDPPYNTGNDFIYEDDYKEPLQRYKKVTSQCVKSNPESMGRFHTNWLNMMYPRLLLAASLLRDDGVIFISIDDNEIDNLKKLCNEAFGEENFIAQIVWEKVHTRKNSAKYFSSSHEYILCYAKQKENFNRNLLPRDNTDAYKNPDNDPNGCWKLDPITAHNYYDANYQIVKPNGYILKRPQNRYWVYSEENWNKKILENAVVWGEGNSYPMVKRYLKDVQDGLVPITLFSREFAGDSSIGNKDLSQILDMGALMSYPKPVKLIKRLLQIGTNMDDIILDFFSGSATTAHAVMQLNAEDGGNRQFIIVQLPEMCDEKSEAYKAGYKNICEIGKERIRRVGKKILEENNQLKLEERKRPIDVGFKVFKLDTSNIYEWDSTPIDEEEITLFRQRIMDTMSGIKSDRTDLEVIYEIMLKMGAPLNIPIFQIEINNKKAYSIDEDCKLLVCFERGITPEDIEAMKEYAPVCLIMSEAGFLNDSVLANAHFILKDTGIELKLV